MYAICFTLSVGKVTKPEKHLKCSRIPSSGKKVQHTASFVCIFALQTRSQTLAREGRGQIGLPSPQTLPRHVVTVPGVRDKKSKEAEQRDRWRLTTITGEQGLEPTSLFPDHSASPRHAPFMDVC